MIDRRKILGWLGALVAAPVAAKAAPGGLRYDKVHRTIVGGSLGVVPDTSRGSFRVFATLSRDGTNREMLELVEDGVGHFLIPEQCRSAETLYIHDATMIVPGGSEAHLGMPNLKISKSDGLKIDAIEFSTTTDLPIRPGDKIETEHGRVTVQSITEEESAPLPKTTAPE